jgi:hypothetical protein
VSEPVIKLRQFRKRLPDRRPGDRWRFKSAALGNRTVHVGEGYYPDSYPHRPELGEIFIAGPKIGSELDAMVKEWAALLSVAMQYGMPLREYADNVQRDPSGRPLTVLGEIVDRLVKGEKS